MTKSDGTEIEVSVLQWPQVIIQVKVKLIPVNQSKNGHTLHQLFFAAKDLRILE